MDRHALALLIPVIGISIVGFVVLSLTRIGKALAHRLEGRLDSDTETRLANLEAAHEDVLRQLAEAHERLDFAERALTRGTPVDR